MDPNNQFNPQPNDQPPQDGSQPVSIPVNTQPSQSEQQQSAEVQNNFEPASQQPVAPQPDMAQQPMQPQQPVMPPAPMGQPMMPTQPMQPQPMQPSMGGVPQQQQFGAAKSKSKLPLIIGGAVLGLAALGGVIFGVMSLLGGGVTFAEFKSEEGNFSINYPEGWETDESTLGVEFTENEVEGVENKYLSVMSAGVAAKEDVGEDYDTQEKAFKAYREQFDGLIAEQSDDADDYVTSHNFKEISVNGIPALLLEIEMKNYNGDGDEETGSGRLALIYGDDGIAVINMAAHSSDSKYIKAFGDILNSYKKL